jgi:predicted murein hydrolase (TIGR00659 family)
MNNILIQTTYFGVAISIFAYWIGYRLQMRWKHPLLNPLLISILLIISFLKIFHIEYETYHDTAKYLTYFLTPATVCLAVPLYKQFQVLKDNLATIFVSILCGCITHILILTSLAIVFHVDYVYFLSLLPKSVTTPIALGISEEIGGIGAITVIGLVIAGMLGAIIGPSLLKLIRVNDPVAVGLAIGTASHAVGTSKAVELGEIQAAMSSLSIVVTGLITVILVPLFLHFFGGY